VDRPTVDVYERRAVEWVSRRQPVDLEPAEQFAAWAGPRRAGGALVDLGCGPGWHSASLGAGPVVAIDAAQAMLDEVPRFAPAALRVRADLAHLPVRPGSLGAAFASKSYVHLARAEVPLALAELHRSLAVGSPAEITVFPGRLEHGALPDDDFPGRRFSTWDETLLRDVVEGAGFALDDLRHEPPRGKGEGTFRVRATRARTLADTVGPAMRLLVVGLNPSVYAADAGVGFARPGNRFWPAALAAGLVDRDRDPWHALRVNGVGMTDLVKRATARADELSTDEYRHGVERLGRLIAWLRPRVLCVVGLAGWRAAVDRRARPGRQARTLAGVPVYLVGSTSGLNAHHDLTAITAGFRAALDIADAPREP